MIKNLDEYFIAVTLKKSWEDLLTLKLKGVTPVSDEERTLGRAEVRRLDHEITVWDKKHQKLNKLDFINNILTK